MTTPKKGDLVIVRENKGAFKKDVLYAAEVDFFLDGYFVVRRLSDGFIVASWPDGGIHTIEEVISNERLPRPRPVDLMDDIVKREASSLYPLEVGDEVEIVKYDRAAGLYFCEPGEVVRRRESSAKVKGSLSRKLYSVDAKTGMESGHPDYPAYANITRKHKHKQNMCNKKFEYKPGQKFYSTSGIKFEVVSVAGDIAYARRISEPMWLTRIEYNDGKHVCVDDPCVTFKPLDPPLVAEAKELVSELYRNPDKVEQADKAYLGLLAYYAKLILK